MGQFPEGFLILEDRGYLCQQVQMLVTLAGYSNHQVGLLIAEVHSVGVLKDDYSAP